MDANGPSAYYLDRGPKWFREAYNDLVDLIFQFAPLAGSGLVRNDTKLGRLLSVSIAPGKGGGAAVQSFPWKISVTGNDTDGYLASVGPGTVNSLLPTNIFYTFSISTGINYIKLDCLSDGKIPTNLGLVMNGTATPGLFAIENEADSEFWDLIGIVYQTTDGMGHYTNTIFNVRRNNLTATPVIDFIASRTPPGPGEEPFVRWFKWSISGG